MKTKLLIISLTIFSIIVLTKILLSLRIKLRLLINNDYLIQIKIGFFQYFNITSQKEVSRNIFKTLDDFLENPVTSYIKMRRNTAFLKAEKAHLLDILHHFNLRKVTLTPCVKLHNGNASFILFGWYINIYLKYLLDNLFLTASSDEYYQVTIDYDKISTIKFDLLFDITIGKLLFVTFKNIDTFFDLLKIIKENKKNDEQSNCRFT